MRRFLFCSVAFAFSSVHLSGCAPVSTLPSEEELIAMAQNLPTEEDIKERFRAVGGVLREICTSDEYAPYFGKTPCLATDVTARQKADRSRITERQKTAMTAALAEIEELNRKTRELMIESQIEPYVSLAQHAQDVTDKLAKINQDNLLAGRITWGEYNTQRESLALRVMQNRAAQQALDDVTDHVKDGQAARQTVSGQTIDARAH